MRSLVRLLVGACLLVASHAQQARDRLELLLPPRLEFQYGMGMRPPAKLFLTFGIGSQTAVVSLPFAAERGLDELRRLVQEQPTAGQRHHELGLALGRRARQSRSDPGLGSANTSRVAVRLRRDARFHLLEAERLMRVELRTTPSAATQLSYAHCLRSLDRDSEARVLITELVESEPPSWAALLELADVQFDERVRSVLPAFLSGSSIDAQGLWRDTERSLALINKAIAIAPDRTEPYLARFRHFIDQGLMQLRASAPGPWEVDLLAGLRADARRVRELAHDRVDLIAWSHVVESMLIVVRQVAATLRAEGVPPDLAEPSLAALLAFAAKMRAVATAEELTTLRAADAFLDGLGADPTLADAALLGRLFVALGTADSNATMTVFDDLRERIPEVDAVFEALLLIAGKLQKLGQGELEAAAVRALLEEIDDSATTVLPHLVAAWWACERELFEDAVREFRFAVSRAPHMQEAWVGLGVALLRAGGGRREARAALERALGLPHHAEANVLAVAHYGLGLIAAGEARWSAAIGHFEPAGQLDPEHPGIPREHADALRELAQVEPGRGGIRAALLLEVRAAELFIREHGRKGDSGAALASSLEVDLLGEAAACLDRAKALEDAAGFTPGELLRTKLLRLAVKSELVRARSSRTGERDVANDLVHVMAELGEHGRTAEDSYLLARVLAALAQHGDATLVDALAAAQEAVRASLGRDPEHLVLVARILQAAERRGEAIAAFEQALAIYVEMFGDTMHVDRDRAETLLLPLYHQDSRWQRLVALCDERAERLIASSVDLTYAAGLHLQPAGVMQDAFDPAKAREYALRAIRIGLARRPEGKLVLSCAHYRCGDLEQSLDAARGALAELRALAGGGASEAEVAAFYSRLGFLLASDPDGEWAAALRKMLTPAEQARFGR